MINIVKNTSKLLMRDKSFVYLITAMPVLLFLVMSILLPYTEMHSIAIINNSEDSYIENALNNIEGIEIQDIDEDKIAESMIQGIVELVVVIADNPAADVPVVQIISAGDSEIQNVVELTAATAAGNADKGITSVNSVNRGKYNLGNTSAFMLYKFIEGGSILGAMIIIERKKRVTDRIMLSGIKPAAYIGGITVTYLIFTFVGTLLYYLTALVLDFDFGMRHSIHYLLLICLANAFAASFFVFASSFVRREEVLGAVTTFIIMPMAFFSGLFFPFKYMPEIFKTIASFFPQRWIAHGIEQVQQSGKFSAAFQDIVLLIILSVVLFGIGAYRNSGKVLD